MTSGWNLSMRLDALEVVERLEAGVAAVERLAGCRAELALERGRRRSAARAGCGHVAPPQVAHAADGARGRRDAVGQQLAAPLLAQPVTRPGRRQYVGGDGVEARGPECAQDVRLDDGVCGAA